MIKSINDQVYSPKYIIQQTHCEVSFQKLSKIEMTKQASLLLVSFKSLTSVFIDLKVDSNYLQPSLCAEEYLVPHDQS